MGRCQDGRALPNLRRRALPPHRYVRTLPASQYAQQGAAQMGGAGYGAAGLYPAQCGQMHHGMSMPPANLMMNGHVNAAGMAVHPFYGAPHHAYPMQQQIGQVQMGAMAHPQYPLQQQPMQNMPGHMSMPPPMMAPTPHHATPPAPTAERGGASTFMDESAPPFVHQVSFGTMLGLPHPGDPSRAHRRIDSSCSASGESTDSGERLGSSLLNSPRISGADTMLQGVAVPVRHKRSGSDGSLLDAYTLPGAKAASTDASSGSQGTARSDPSPLSLKESAPKEKKVGEADEESKQPKLGPEDEGDDRPKQAAAAMLTLPNAAKAAADAAPGDFSVVAPLAGDPRSGLQSGSSATGGCSTPVNIRATGATDAATEASDSASSTPPLVPTAVPPCEGKSPSLDLLLGEVQLGEVQPEPKAVVAEAAPKVAAEA